MSIRSLCSFALLLAALPCPTSGAQVARPAAQPTVTEIRVPGRQARARLWTEVGPDGRATPFYSLSLDGTSFGAPRAAQYDLLLRAGRFDPLQSSLEVRADLAARADARLFVVQYWTQGIEDYRATLRALGAEILLFLAQYANVVEVDAEGLAKIQQLSFVRAVTPFHPAYKLEAQLLEGIERGLTEDVTVNLLTMRRGGQAPVARWIEARGGTIEHVSEPTHLMTARLSFAELAGLAGRNDVQWIDRWAAPEDDMNKARILHGADDVETLHGVTGQGVRVEVMDSGFDTTHPDMQSFLLHNTNSPGDHGTCTSGIVVGTGLGRAAARGAAPDAFLVVADYGHAYAGGSRYAHTGQLVNPLLAYQCVLQSNSWGTGLTLDYSSVSQDMDLILFDMERISICQSQSNNGDQWSRPQAWAKNIISVGGIFHNDTTVTSDDSWSGGASIGPAADGRIKPDIASFYDAIQCPDMVGSAGYSGNNYTTSFGGTSGATPIVAGHLALVYEMWHMGLFGNPTPGATVFENAPYNTTAKALLINSATQWTFSGTGHDLTRTHQGWGHPDLGRLSESTARMFVVDESDVLADQESTVYSVSVLPGEARLRVTLVYRDPPGTTSSSLHRINDLDLTVQAPNGDLYRGNYGLDANQLSLTDGTADSKNTVENVFVQAPQDGTWTVTVTAVEVNQDAHVESGAVDVDYALVVSGAEPVPTAPPLAPSHLRGRASGHTAHLSFRDNSGDEDGFEIERSDDGLVFTPLATLGENEETHVDAGLTLHETYYYRVRAYNVVGASAYSTALQLVTRKTERSDPPQ